MQLRWRFRWRGIMLIAAMIAAVVFGNFAWSLTSSSPTDLALNHPAYASSTESGGYGENSSGPGAAVDGNLNARWSSLDADPQWIYVDLGATYNVSEVKLSWETAYGKAYQIQVSNNATNWSTIYSTATGTGGLNDLTGLSGSGRYVRVYGTVRGTHWGYSLWEFAVYGSAIPMPTPTPSSTTTPTPTPTHTSTPTPTPSPTPSGGCDLSSFNNSSQPSCFTFFGSGSPFNTPLPANPKLVANSSSIISYMESNGWSFQTSGNSSYPGPTLNSGIHGASRPVFFAHPSDPLVKLTSCSYGGLGCTDYNRATFEGTSFHVPQGASPFPNTDGHFTVIETDTGIEYDFWEAAINWSNDTMTATNGGEVNAVTGSGYPGQSQGAEASQNPLLAGLVRPSEVLAAQSTGQIDHAVTLEVGCVQAISPPVWPSSNPGSDSPCNNSSGPHFGTLLKLNWTDTQIKASGAYPWEQGYMYAMAHYGAYIVDTNGGGDNTMHVNAQAFNSWTDFGLADQWSVVDPMITGGTGGSSPILQSNVVIPISSLVVVDPCVQQHACP